nr:hypothetical protein [Anaerolineae bacterium]
ELLQAGIEPGERVEAGSHNNVVTAVYNGEAEFGTTFFSPPAGDFGAWSIGDNPEPYDLTVEESFIGEDGALYVGNVQILDTLSFGPEFPPELSAQIVDALIEFSTTEAWAESIGSEDFYGWSSIEVVSPSLYDIVRGQFTLLGLTEEDVFGN